MHGSSHAGETIASSYSFRNSRRLQWHAQSHTFTLAPRTVFEVEQGVRQKQISPILAENLR
jgi:hypothetical protein